MRCADEGTLHEYAAGAMDEGTRALWEQHLGDCPGCREGLTRVGAAVRLLRAAAATRPEVDWRRADDAVLSAVTGRFARRAWWRAPGWGWAGALAAAALAVFAWTSARRGAPELAVAATPVLAGVTVEAAHKAHFEGGALQRGAALRKDSAIRTAVGGAVLVKLPEESLARIASSSELSVARATREEIALRLEHGSVAVSAAHAQRKEFVIAAGTVEVRVVGTVFRVLRGEDQVEVAVAEGKVLVEPRQGDGRLVGAGRRVRIGADGAWEEEEALGADDLAAFEELGVKVAVPKATPAEVVASAPERPRRSRPVPPAPAPAPQPVPPGALAPALAAPAAAAPVEPGPTEALPSSSPDEWALPQLRDPEPQASRAPGLAERTRANGLAVTVEGLFLQRAQEALKSGRCASYLLGLQDVVEGSEDRAGRELARILRARCFDEQLRPTEAALEYRKYLEQYPAGRFAAEARRAVSE